MHIPQLLCTVSIARGKALSAADWWSLFSCVTQKSGSGPQDYSWYVQHPELNALAQCQDLALPTWKFYLLTRATALVPDLLPEHSVFDTFPASHWALHHCESYLLLLRCSKGRRDWIRMYLPWQIWNPTASNTIISIIHILKGLAHPPNKFSHWSDCSLTGNRLKPAKCNQRSLSCKAEITIHLCCVRLQAFARPWGHSQALWSQLLLLPPQTHEQSSAACSWLESLKHLVICLHLRWSHSHCWGLAAGILVGVLTNANEITTFLLIQTWKLHHSASVHSNAPCISEKEDSA